MPGRTGIRGSLSTRLACTKIVGVNFECSADRVDEQLMLFEMKLVH
jgi:hypothetical protein